MSLYQTLVAACEKAGVPYTELDVPIEPTALDNITANSLSSRSTYHAPQPRTVLVRVTGKLPPFSTSLQCYWMNGKGKPNFYTPVQFTD